MTNKLLNFFFLSLSRFLYHLPVHQVIALGFGLAFDCTIPGQPVLDAVWFRPARCFIWKA